MVNHNQWVMETGSEVREYPCESWEGFIDALRGKPGRQVFGDRIYRGHSDVNHELSSIQEREIKRWLETKGDEPMVLITVA